MKLNKLYACCEESVLLLFMALVVVERKEFLDPFVLQT